MTTDPDTALAALRAPGGMVGPLWVVTCGAGRPLVLLHGNGEDHHVFDRMVPALVPGRTLVGVDARGHGRSPRGTGPLRIARMAQDVAQVLDLLGLADVDVLGFSDGGNVALELVLQRPDLVGRLVVVGANLDAGGLTARTLRRVRAERAVVRGLARVLPALRSRAERLALMVDDPCIDPRGLGRVRARTLVVTGERDVVRPSHTALLTASVPGARCVVVPGAGHMLPVEHPTRLAAVVTAFLGDVPPPGDVH